MPRDPGLSRAAGFRGIHAHAPERLFFTGALARGLRSGLGACRSRFRVFPFRGRFRSLDLDLGFVGKSVGSAGYDLVVFGNALDDLYLFSIANSEFHRLLMRASIRAG